MIEYIINTQNGSEIYQTFDTSSSKQTALSYIKTLCIQACFTFEGYLKAVKKVHQMSYKIPLYINEEVMLIPIGRYKDYETVWINYPAIKEITPFKEGLKVTFYSSIDIYLKISLNQMKKQIKHLHLIRNTKVKHFHMR